MRQQRTVTLAIAFGISCLLHAGAVGLFYLLPDRPTAARAAVQETSLQVQFEKAAPSAEVDRPLESPPSPSIVAPAIAATPLNESPQVPPPQPAPSTLKEPEAAKVVQGPAVDAAASIVVASGPVAPVSEQVITHYAAGFSTETSKPDYLRNPKPKYPRAARERHWQGTVLLRVEVLADGTAGQIEIAKSSGFPVLDEAALQAVHAWKFLPARVGETSVRSQVEVPIVFRLENE